MKSDKEDFLQRFNVSRETLERLELYEQHLLRWNKKINLISPVTVPRFWSRHLSDSAQVLKIAPQDFQHWADLGSGGGFPGVVIGIMRKNKEKSRVTLVESDQRKAAFLRTVARECEIELTVDSRRIEELPPLDADVISARALAPLETLLSYAERHMSPEGCAIFLKGKKAQHEVRAALETWRFRCEKHKSITDSDGVLLKIGDIERV